jgi:hypothetical protein
MYLDVMIEQQICDIQSLYVPDETVILCRLHSRADIYEVLFNKVYLFKGILKLVLTYNFSTRDEGCFFSI